MQTGLPTKLVPLKWVVKYEPPQLGLVYQLNEKDKKKRLYIIELNDLVMVPDCLRVANRLFLEHPLYLNKSVVQVEQVAKLVEIIQDKFNLAKVDDDDQMYGGYEENEQFAHQNFQNQQNIKGSGFDYGYEEISDNEYQ